MEELGASLGASLAGWFVGAALFPPVSAPIEEAVAAHRGHLGSSYGGMLGALAVPDTALADLVPLLADGDDPLAVRVVVTGGAGALEPAVRWAGRAPGLRLTALQIALRDEEDLPRNAGRMVAMLDHLRFGGELDEDVPVLIEPPRLAHVPEHGWLAALDEIAMADLALVFRIAGTTTEVHPTSEELARSIDAALDRETPFGLVGGVPPAVSGPDPETGGHGFLNVLGATRVALDGGDVAEALRRQGPVAGPDALASVRRWCGSAATADVPGTHRALVAAGAP